MKSDLKLIQNYFVVYILIGIVALTLVLVIPRGEQDTGSTTISSETIGLDSAAETTANEPIEEDATSNSEEEAIAVDNTEEVDTATVVEESEPTAYYSFSVAIKSTSLLHVRKEPSMDAEVVAKFKKGTSGIVLEKGDDWSLITTGNTTGYCSNEYLELTEISEEEYNSQL